MSTRADRHASAADALAVAQGAFYLATGVWPLLHVRSFEAVTGERRTTGWWKPSARCSPWAGR